MHTNHSDIMGYTIKMTKQKPQRKFFILADIISGGGVHGGGGGGERERGRVRMQLVKNLMIKDFDD